MDNYNLPTMKDRLKSLLTRKNILIFFGVIIALEIIWAAWSFLNPGKEILDLVAQRKIAPATQISLFAPSLDLKVGERISVSINISSAKRSDGTDLVINYDPKRLGVVLSEGSKTPVSVGRIYSDYPLNSVDEELGRITVSGITASKGGVNTKGVFGSILFEAKAPGVTKVSIDYTKDKTTDTNIIESGTGKDMLEGVSDLDFKINP